MPDHARRTGAALESALSISGVDGSGGRRFPKTHKFTLGDRIVITALDILDALVEATYTRERMLHLRRALVGWATAALPLPTRSCSSARALAILGRGYGKLPGRSAWAGRMADPVVRKMSNCAGHAPCPPYGAGLALHHSPIAVAWVGNGRFAVAHAVLCFGSCTCYSRPTVR